jgi:DNA-binding response OmpR family regulator
VNDFGPGSIDSWLSEVVGRELATDEPTVLDPAARRLVLDGRAVDLTRLELDVLRHMRRREGVAVTREELLREVWGHEWTGASSNVVEAVVSGLRKKMGDRAAALETVRGVGYRLGPLD